MKAHLVIAALLLGCGFGDATLEEVDPEAAPATPTWSEHVEPLMVWYCTACHSPDAQPGEAEGYGYETCAKTKKNWGPLVESVYENQDMPPGGALRLTEAEKLTLTRWHEQGARCD